jgi:hypothetical protein
MDGNLTGTRVGQILKGVLMLKFGRA